MCPRLVGEFHTENLSSEFVKTHWSTYFYITIGNASRSKLPKEKYFLFQSKRCWLDQKLCQRWKQQNHVDTSQGRCKTGKAGSVAWRQRVRWPNLHKQDLEAKSTTTITYKYYSRQRLWLDSAAGVILSLATLELACDILGHLYSPRNLETLIWLFKYRYESVILCSDDLGGGKASIEQHKTDGTPLSFDQLQSDYVFRNKKGEKNSYSWAILYQHSKVPLWYVVLSS